MVIAGTRMSMEIELICGLSIMINRKNIKEKVIDLIRFVIFFQLAIVGATIIGCFVAKSNKCAEADKQHIANMMTVITTSTFALYAAEK